MRSSIRSALVCVAASLCAPARAAEPAEPPLSAQDLAFLCALPPGLKAYPHIASFPRDGAAFDAATRRAGRVAMRRLPPAIPCPGGERKLVNGAEFLDSFGFSADHSLAVVTGGYQRGPLDGQGGECWFEQKGEDWRFLGCRGTWVS